MESYRISAISPRRSCASSNSKRLWLHWMAAVLPGRICCRPGLSEGEDRRKQEEDQRKRCEMPGVWSAGDDVLYRQCDGSPAQRRWRAGQVRIQRLRDRGKQCVPADGEGELCEHADGGCQGDGDARRQVLRTRSSTRPRRAPPWTFPPAPTWTRTSARRS
jgi:hypothetical protein